LTRRFKLTAARVEKI